jgi:hypothetical protein
MEIRENLEMIEVNYDDGRKKATMVFLDAERGEIREVNFNLQSFKDGKYVDDPEKAEKVEKWCAEYFNTTFANLPSCVGQKKTVYCYDRFNSLFEVDQVTKFADSMKGKLYQTTIEEIKLDDYAIRIRYKIEGNLYESKMSFGKYLENLQQWFVDPIKKEKAMTKFKEKYGVDISEADKLTGAKLIVEVKSAFGTHLYGDCKPLPN